MSSDKGKWREVTKRNPCPHCGKDSWCSISADGAIRICHWEPSGSFKTETDKNGSPYYLHRVAGHSRTNTSFRRPTKSKTAPAIADLDTRHKVYSALLAELSLSASGIANLKQRGLSDEVIKQNGYKTLEVRGRAKIAKKLNEQFGDVVLKVPGFIVKEEKGETYISLAGAAGTVIPCRDVQGRITALVVRRDGAGEGPRYTYVSSAKADGPSPGSPVHVSLGIQGPTDTVRMTEGALKSDVAWALSQVPTISAPGVSNWRPCLDVSKSLGAKTVRLAFDADAGQKVEVANSLFACSTALAEEEYAIELEIWDIADGKGIDDLLAAGKTPSVLCGKEATGKIRDIAFAHHWNYWATPHDPAQLAAANVLLMAVGQGTESIVASLQSAPLPEGWFGVTARAWYSPVALATFARGKAACLVRGTFLEPNLDTSEKVAAILLAAGAAEVRQICPGWGFFDKPHTTEEIAALMEKAEVFEPPPEKSDPKAELTAEEKSTLDRLGDTLKGGAEAFFRDDKTLQTLAKISLNDPAEFAAMRAKVKEAKLSVRDLDKALKPIVLEFRHQQASATSTTENQLYLIKDGCICREKFTADGGTVTIPLCNFDAVITEQVIHDDGAERKRFLALEGSLANNTPLPRSEVPAEEFPRMEWPVSAWGTTPGRDGTD